LGVRRLINRSLGGVVRCEPCEARVFLSSPVVTDVELDYDQRPHRLLITWNQPVSVNGSLLHVYSQDTDLVEPVQYEGTAGSMTMLSFPDAHDGYGILRNGNYEIQIPPGAVSNGSGDTMTGTYYGGFWFLNGDIDRNRVVDATDYAIVDNGFVNHLSGWSSGDLDYNGVIDGSDYSILDNSFVNRLPAVTDFYVFALPVDPVLGHVMRLSWTDNVTNEAYWRVERAEAGGSYEVLTTLPGGSTSHDDSNLPDGTWYSYRVKAVDGWGTAIVTTPKRGAVTVLPPPTGVSAAALPTGGIELTWTDPTNAEAAYSIERRDGVSGQVFQEVGATFADQTSWIDYSVSAGQAYVYRISAVNANARSAPSTPTSSTTAPAPQAPNPLAHLASELSARRTALQEIALEWTDKTAGEVGFRIFRRIGESGTWDLLHQAGPNRTQFFDRGLPTGTIASYHLYAFGPFGVTPPSNIVTVRSPTEVHAVAATSTSIDVSWTFPWTDPAKFYVEAIDRARYLKYGRYPLLAAIAGFQRVAELPGSARSHRVSGLVDGETYFFLVIAQNADGTSGLNQTSETMTEPAPAIAPLPPENLQTQRFNYTGFNLTWEDKSAGNAGYVIRTRRDFDPFDSDGLYIPEGHLTQYSLQLWGSNQRSTTYEIEVRAYTFGDCAGGVRESEPIRQTVVVPTLPASLSRVEWVSITPGSAWEGGTGSFTVNGGSIDNPVTVDLLLFGSATYGVDYTIPMGLSLNLSGSPIQVPVTGVADYLLEGDETITVVALASASHWGAIATMALGDQWLLHPTIRPAEVTYSGRVGANFKEIERDDGTGRYSAPHWKDNSPTPDGDADDPGDRKYPVAYVRGAEMKIEAKFTIHPDLGLIADRFLVRGNTAYSYQFSGDTATGDAVENSVVISGSTMIVKDIASAAFENYVNHFDPFTIEWQVSIDGGKTWGPAGTTKNQVYVLLGQPVFPASRQKLYHTLAHNGTLLAKGESHEGTVISRIFADFQDRKVEQVATATTRKRLLSYYSNWGAVATDTLGLLTNGDGQCGAWAHLFIDMLRAQGIEDRHQWVEIKPSRADADGFLVKDWEFRPEGGRSGDATYPYVNFFLGSPYGPTGYSWTFADVSDKDGKPGQNKPNPIADFRVHHIVKIGLIYFDPSYGRSHSDLLAFEDWTVAGVFRLVTRVESEIVRGADLNRDGDTTDASVVVDGFYIRRNDLGDGLDVTATPRNDAEMYE